MNKSEFRKKEYLKRRKAENAGIFGESVCPLCGERIFYFCAFDSDCCLGCNTWLNKKCSDPCCPYCSHRPDSPLEAMFYISPHIGGGKRRRQDNYAHKERGRMRKERRHRA